MSVQQVASGRIVPAGVWICLIFSSVPSGASVSVQIGLNFTGATLGIDSDALPPDSNGTVGPTNFVQFINGRYTVFDKATGTNVQTMTDRDFWVNARVPLPNNLQPSDPRLIYDPSSQRWFASQIDVDPNVQITNRFLLAVSTTADPTLSWKGFAFRADPQARTFADFPTLGLDANGVYLCGELFDDLGNDIGPTLVMIPKSDLLAATPTVAGRNYVGALASGAIGQSAITLGTASTSESVLAIGDLGLDFAPHSTLAAFTVALGTGAGKAVLAASQVLSIPSYSVPINPTQPNGLDNLDNGDARISASVYRIGDTLYAVHGTEVNKRAALQWFKIDAVTFSILQTDVISDPTLDLFYPSIAANAAGIVVLAFNASSQQSFVSSYARVGELVNGSVVFGPAQLLKSGTASFVTSITGTSRWGDYSATSVDPTDPNHFWTIQMIPTQRTTWSTQITELMLSSSTSSSPVSLSITRGPNDAVISWPTNAANFQLQFTPALSSTNNTWSTVSPSLTVVSNMFQTVVPTSTSQGFYRLIQP
jgi:hypothetical protein